MSVSPPNGDTPVVPQRTRRTSEHGNRSEADLRALLQKGEDNAQRLSLHTCLLERRLRGGAEPADLLVLVQDLKFAVEEIQTLLQSAVQTVTPAFADPRGTAHAPEEIIPLQPKVVELSPLLTRWAASVRQQAKRRGISLLCDIASDLPSLSTDPETLAQAFSVLLEHVVRTGSKGGLEVQVHWTDGVLVVDIYDAGRGISRETYIALRDLIGRLQGSLKVTQELGKRSRVEFSFPPASTQGNGVLQVASFTKKGNEK